MASLEELERDWTFDDVDLANGMLDAFEDAQERERRKAERESTQ